MSVKNDRFSQMNGKPATEEPMVKEEAKEAPAKEKEQSVILLQQIDSIVKEVKELSNQVEAMAKAVGETGKERDEAAGKALEEAKAAYESLTEKIPSILNAAARNAEQQAAVRYRQAAPSGGIVKSIASMAFAALLFANLFVLVPWIAYSLYAGDTYRRLETIRYDVIHPEGDAYIRDGKILRVNGIDYYVRPDPAPEEWDRVKRIQNEIDYMRAQDRKAQAGG